MTADNVPPPSQTLHALMRYTAWANERLYEALAPLGDQQLARPMRGRPGGALGVLGHLHVVALIWKGHLTGAAHGFLTRSLEPLPPLAELREMQRGVDAWYVDFAAHADARMLSRPIDFRFVDGGAGRMTAQEMVLHVANHGTYHRGYVADMLYEWGHKPPTMDLPVFIRDAG